MERAPPHPKAEARYAFDYDDVQPSKAPRAYDTLGLSADDRKALGMTAPRAGEAAPLATPDAAAALRELLAQGAALGKDPRRRK